MRTAATMLEEAVLVCEQHVVTLVGGRARAEGEGGQAPRLGADGVRAALRCVVVKVVVVEVEVEVVCGERRCAVAREANRR